MSAEIPAALLKQRTQTQITTLDVTPALNTVSGAESNKDLPYVS
jgi:hypothetical protein